jgi:4,5-DOPA dioxygenase extradiol
MRGIIAPLTTMTQPLASTAPAVDRRAARVRRVPSLFLAHGSPMTVIDKDYAGALRKFVSHQHRLRAIVVVSAHWQTSGTIRVTSNPKPSLIYDFMGFPGWLYEVAYPCPGDRAIAQTVAILLERAGIAARLDPERGLDHGVWVPLSMAFPEAILPVVQVSLPLPSTPTELLAMGRALAPLRTQDILLIGTGGIVHNLAHLHSDMADGTAEPWAEAFDGWVREKAGTLDADALAGYQRLAPHAGAAVPTSEHFDPLLFVMGTVLPGDSFYDLYAGFRYGTLSLRSFAITGRRREDRGF